MKAPPLTLAEFKKRLADEESRKQMGVHLTDQEALRALVDDQKIADLYVEWRTQPAPAPAPEGPASVPLFRRRAFWLVIAAAAVVAGIVVAANALTNQVRADRYVELLRSDENVTLDSVPDDQLKDGLDYRCRMIAEGRTLQDELAAAKNTTLPPESDLTERQYYANVRGLFLAAEAVC
jgi:hypothetical protein